MKTHGFTLVEVLLTIMLVAILAGVCGFFLNQSVSLYTLVRARGEAVYKTDYAMKRILEGAMTVANPGTQITIASATQFKFVHPTRGTLLYRYLTHQNPDGTGSLYERVGNGVNNLLATEVSTFAFTYYKNGGPLVLNNTTTTLSAISYVQISMTVATVPDYKTVPVEKGVFLRNRSYIDF